MGGGLAGIGVVLMVVGGLMLLWAAFKESLLWGIGSIIVPFVALVFVVTHWSQAKVGFLVQLLDAAETVVPALTPETLMDAAPRMAALPRDARSGL